MLSGRALGVSWVEFWIDFEGSGEAFGRVLGEFGGSKIVVLLGRVFFSVSCLVVLLDGVWAENKVP